MRLLPDSDRRARTLHLVDIENLLGFNPLHASLHHVREALARYADASKLRHTDHIIVGCNPKLAMSVNDTLQGAGRIVVRRGVNGADIALLDSVDVDRWADRFDRIVIGSGDHAFAHTVRKLRNARLEVIVVAIDDQVSVDLRDSATAYRPLGYGRSSTQAVRRLEVAA